jgi:hypothetical protein
MAYATSKNRMPPTMSMPTLMPDAFLVGGASYNEHLIWGWVPPVLNEMSQGAIYDKMVETLKGVYGGAASESTYANLFTNAYLAELRCPSDTTYESLDQPWLSYYLNGGRANIAPEPFGYGSHGVVTGTQSTPAEFRATPPDWKVNGACMTRLTTSSASSLAKMIIEEQANAVDDIARGDGVSTTILLTENVNPRRFSDDPFSGSGPVLKNTWSNTFYTTSGAQIVRPWEHDNAVFWQDVLDYPDEDGNLASINQHKDHDDVLSPAFARPASFHPGLVVVTFCDGHTQKLSETIDYQVYALLMSSKGRDAKLPGTSTAGPGWQNNAVTEAQLTP